MQRVLGFLAIYNRLKNKRGIITKTKNTIGGNQFAPTVLRVLAHESAPIVGFVVNELLYNYQVIHFDIIHWLNFFPVHVKLCLFFVSVL
jgi:hypothetical protein